MKLTFNKKETAELLNVSGGTIDALEKNKSLTRLKAFPGVRFSIQQIEKIAELDKKTTREKMLEEEIQKRDEVIDNLHQLLINNFIYKETSFEKR